MLNFNDGESNIAYVLSRNTSLPLLIRRRQNILFHSARAHVLYNRRKNCCKKITPYGKTPPRPRDFLIMKLYSSSPISPQH